MTSGSGWTRNMPTTNRCDWICSFFGEPSRSSFSDRMNEMAVKNARSWRSEMARFIVVALLLITSPTALPAAVPIGEQTVVAPGLDAQAPRPGAAITPLDRLQVTVFREPELSVADVQVDEGGRVLLPLVGALTAAGKSSEVLASEITSKLRKYIREPQVAVSIKQTATRRVTVAGSVVEPGVYPLEGRTTLLQAVALAKGPSQVASLNQTLI